MKKTSPFVPRYRLDFKLRVLAALDANEGGMSQTARQLRIPYSTLWDWNQNREEIRQEVETLRQTRGITLPEQFEALIQQMVGAMSDKVERARLLETVRVLAMVLDLSKQMEAEQGKSSGAKEKLAELLERYAAKNVEDAEMTSGGEIGLKA